MKRPFILALVALTVMAVAGCASIPAAASTPWLTRYSLSTVKSYPEGITVDSEGNVWFAEAGTSKIGELAAPTGSSTGYTLTETALPSGSVPVDIVQGSDGNMWFTNSGTGTVNDITEAGVLGTPVTPGDGGTPYGITQGPSGEIWYTNESENSVGMIDESTGVDTDYALPTSSPDLEFPVGITYGPDGDLWIVAAEYDPPIGGPDYIVQMTTSGSVVNTYSTGEYGAEGITVGPDGNLWIAFEGEFVDYYAGSGIGQLTTSGTFTFFTSGLTAASVPVDIASGPDGDLWFTEYTGQIGKITTSGTITEYPLSNTDGTTTQDTCPTGIAAGTNDDVWFTEGQESGDTCNETDGGGNDVAEFDPVPSIASVSPSTVLASTGGTVTATCSGCLGATSVTIGSTTTTTTPCPASPTAACFTVNAAGTDFTAFVPSGAVGTVENLAVTTPFGTSATTTADTVTLAPPPPTVTSISPDSGSPSGATSVTITGTNFSGTGYSTLSVNFGDDSISTTPCSSVPPATGCFTVNSATSITLVTPEDAAGSYPLSVTTLGGTSAVSAASTFTVNAAVPVPATGAGGRPLWLVLLSLFLLAGGVFFIRSRGLVMS